MPKSVLPRHASHTGLLQLLLLLLVARPIAGQQKTFPGMSLLTEDRLANSSWWPTDGRPEGSAYAGSVACAECHAGIAASYSQAPMARASMRAANFPSGFPAAEAPPVALNGYTYRVVSSSSSDQLEVTDGAARITAPLAWAFGVGEKGQTYLLEKGGSFVESEVSYYTSPHALDLTTGHIDQHPETLERALGVPLSSSEAARCFGCHTGSSTISGKFDPAGAAAGVQCESCHGPGAAHAAAMRRGDIGAGRRAIFQPGRLAPAVAVDFCGACHRTSMDMVMSANYTPSDIRFQPYRLEKSRCWGSSGDARLTCVACHDPHRPLERDPAAYDHACLSCHLPQDEPHARMARRASACPVGRQKCVTCHMPRYLVSNIHGTFTDHYIRVVRDSSVYPE